MIGNVKKIMKGYEINMIVKIPLNPPLRKGDLLEQYTSKGEI